MGDEIWKPIEDAKGKYEVSSLGRIRHSIRKNILNLKPMPLYYAFTANIGGNKTKLIYLHRALMMAFVGPANGRVVDHIDGNKLNNSFENLRYLSHRENMQNYSLVRGKPKKFIGVQKYIRKDHRVTYRAFAYLDGKNKYVGVFDTPEEANKAYIDAIAKRNPHEANLLGAL